MSTPHGGGGPGAGPVCVADRLLPFLPTPVVERGGAEGTAYGFARPARTIGAIGGFHGNFGVLLRAYAYIRSLGAPGLRQASEDAVLNANYIRVGLQDQYHLPYDRICMHEVVFSARRQKARGVRAMDVAKRLIDYGIHPPTMYFPLIVDEALMIEPTETRAWRRWTPSSRPCGASHERWRRRPTCSRTAPHDTPVGRLDEARAARQPDLRWRPSEG